MEEDNFQIDEFLDENARLIGLLGVFGGLSVYFTRFSEEGGAIWQKLGFVSSLIIFIIISFTIRRKVLRKFEGNIFDFLIKPQRQSLHLALFIISFYLLILSTIGMVLSRPGATTLVVQLLVGITGISSVFWVVENFWWIVGIEDAKIPLGRDYKIKNYVFYLGFIGLVSIFIGLFSWGYFSIQFGYNLISAIQLRLGPGLIPFLFAYTGGILLGGLLYFGLTVLIVVADIVIRILLKREEILDSIKEMNRESSLKQSSIDDFKE